MTTVQVLGRLRRLIEEVDQATSGFTDEELLERLGDARGVLELRGVSGMSALAVQPEQSQANYGITPDATLEQGEMLALQAAGSLLENEFRGRVLRGELGASWQSGLEQESTITAAGVYRVAIDRVWAQLEELVLIKRAPNASTRPQ